MNTKDVGDISEAIVVAKLKEKGKTVSLPFGDNARYDLIVDEGEGLSRVQVKTGNLKNGSIRVPVSSSQRENGDISHTHYTKDQIDMFMIYCEATSEVYKVPVEETGTSMFTLRVREPGNGQSKGINFAEDYVLQ